MRKITYQPIIPRVNYTQEEYNLLIEFIDQQEFECTKMLADFIRSDTEKEAILDALDLAELFNWIKEDLEVAKSMKGQNEK